MNQIRITSASNPIIKELRSLNDKKGRQKENALLLEGFRLVCEAVDSGAAIKYFVISDGFIDKADEILSRFRETKTVIVPDELFGRIGETQSPQGIMAVAELPVKDLDEVVKSSRRIIALENLQDPGNLGTIIRTADACGFEAVLLSKESADPFNPKVVRSTMGSLFHLPVVVAEDIYQTLEQLKTKGIAVLAAHPRDALPCWEVNLAENLVLVIGNEGNGLTPRMLEMSSKTVMIPMDGRTESLNASTAAAMLLYESMRQKSVK